METIKNKLPEDTEILLNKLREYLDTQLYFFGSVQRTDYFHGKSDIDIDVFTDNINSIILKLQNFFFVEKSDFKKVVMRLGYNNKMIYGYKIKIKRPEYNLKCEICIFDEKYKNDIIETHKRKIHLTFYQVFLLYLIKFSYYYLFLFNKSTYLKLKKKVINNSPKTDDDFLVID
jgi:hypothetical protein